MNNAVALGAAGAMECLVGMLRRFSRSAGCMKAACWALYNVCLSCPQNVATLVREGGVAALVEVLENHFASESVSKASCRALQAVAMSREGTLPLSPPFCLVLVF